MTKTHIFNLVSIFIIFGLLIAGCDGSLTIDGGIDMGDGGDGDGGGGGTANGLSQRGLLIVLVIILLVVALVGILR